MRYSVVKYIIEPLVLCLDDGIYTEKKYVLETYEDISDAEQSLCEYRENNFNQLVRFDIEVTED